MANVLITLVFFGGLVVGAVFLQIYLAKAKNKWPGLILPIITFGFSLLIILSFATFSASTRTSMENGVEVVQTIGDPISTVVALTFTFLGCNIPTGILLAIYFATRSKIKKDSDLQKMSVQDLE